MPYDWVIGAPVLWDSMWWSHSKVKMSSVQCIFQPLKMRPPHFLKILATNLPVTWHLILNCTTVKAW